MNPFRSLREYELYVYALPQQFLCIVRSTLVVAQRGRFYAEVNGEIAFPDAYRLNIYERLTWDTGSLVIEGYSYEVWRGDQELCWYDSQPHPDDPTLASTDPHHKHIPPGIKHHRIPAPGLNLDSPNLIFLIREIEALLPSA